MKKLMLGDGMSDKDWALIKEAEAKYIAKQARSRIIQELVLGLIVFAGICVISLIVYRLIQIL